MSALSVSHKKNSTFDTSVFPTLHQMLAFFTVAVSTKETV